MITRHTASQCVMASTDSPSSSVVNRDSPSPSSLKNSPLLKRSYRRTMSGQSTAGIIGKLQFDDYTSILSQLLQAFN